MARSELAAIALACSGCDLAFGLTGDPEPCELSSFEGTTATEITPADDFSIDWDRHIAVIMKDGQGYEVELPGGTPAPIELGPYASSGLSLTPEGNALFFTASVEPPMLMGALRASAGEWIAAPAVPRGTFAGTPSADVFGPRRVLVKMRDTSVDVQEYEDDSGRWVTIGAPHALASTYAPNLTPNGLTMIYAGWDAGGAPAIFGATRPSTDAWFGEPTLLLPGDHRTAQLLGTCSQLYTLDGSSLRRYSR